MVPPFLSVVEFMWPIMNRVEHGVTMDPSVSLAIRPTQFHDTVLIGWRKMQRLDAVLLVQFDVGDLRMLGARATIVRDALRQYCDPNVVTTDVEQRSMASELDKTCSLFLLHLKQ